MLFKIRYILFKTAIFIAFIILSVSLLKAQDENCRQANNPKAVEMYKNAMKKFDNNPKAAEEALLGVVKISPFYTDAFFSLAELYFEQAVKQHELKKDPDEAARLFAESVKYFKKTLELCEQYRSFAAYYYLAKIGFKTKKYRECKTNAETFIQKSNKETEKNEINDCLKKANNYLALIDNPVPYKPVKLSNISTEKDEYLPFLSPDGEQMFFTRKINSLTNPDDFKEYFSWAKRTSKKGDSKEIFTEGNPLPAPFNDGRNQGGASVTVDNRQLFLTICGIEKGAHQSYRNCDIYFTKRENNKWESLMKIGTEINGSSSFEGQPSVSADGKKLFFAGAKPGGVGGMDIYFSKRKSDGSWTAAENIGTVINTSADEKTPFIHPDGRTLYFSSNGHFGMGGFDIFVSRYDDANDTWSKPKNIGFPINTEGDEVGFIVSTDGAKIYFSTNALTDKSSWDIYSNALPDAAKPEQVLLVKGKIKGEDGDSTAKVTVKVTGVRTKKSTEGFVDNHSGDYAVTVPVEQNEKYIFTAQKKGYFYKSIFIDPDKKEYVPPTIKVFKVKKVTENVPFRLNNVNFEFDSYQINDTAAVELMVLADFLKEHAEKRIEIRGHTDNVGTAEHNMELSQNRASGVRNFLIKNGISPSRLTAKGFGQTVPLTTNATEKGRAENRRVEMIFLN